jgi:hypothetical protein
MLWTQRRQAIGDISIATTALCAGPRADAVADETAVHETTMPPFSLRNLPVGGSRDERAGDKEELMTTLIEMGQSGVGVAAELAREMEQDRPDHAGGGAELQGWKEEHVKGVLDLVATGTEVAGIGRSEQRRRGTYQMAHARHQDLGAPV